MKLRGRRKKHWNSLLLKLRLTFLVFQLYMAFVRSQDPPPEPEDPDHLRSGDIISYQIFVDKIELGREVKSREANILILRPIRGSLQFVRTSREIRYTRAYIAILSKHQGTPTRLFIFIIMPILMTSLLAMIFRAIKPSWNNDKLPKTEYPLVPLVYFQQSANEARLKRNSRKTVETISKYFLIRANESYIDLDEIRNAAITRQTLARSPWALIRFMIRLQVIYSHSQNKTGAGGQTLEGNKAAREQLQHQLLLLQQQQQQSSSSDRDRRESVAREATVTVDAILARINAANRVGTSVGEDSTDGDLNFDTGIRKKNARELLKS